MQLLGEFWQLTTFYLELGNKKCIVLDVYESFSGWYWYITQYFPNDPDIAFGFVQGFEEEWGNIYLPELKEQITKGFVWEVPKKNWAWTGRNTPMKELEY